MQFIGVAWRDDVDAMRAFVNSYGVSGFPHVADDGSVFAAYQLVSQPGWAFINDDGATTTILGALGPDGLAENLDKLTSS